MPGIRHRLTPLLLLGALQSVAVVAVVAVVAAEPEESWLDIVRDTPYWESQGVAENLETIRRWVLFSESYCSTPARHILFDRRGNFLGYAEDAATPGATNQQLNTIRENMLEDGRVQAWRAGASDASGYPFALGCNQPFVDIGGAIERLTGADETFLLWGTWDNISVGSPEAMVSLVNLFRTVYEHRRAQQRFSFSERVIPTLLGKVIIESGALPQALSSQNARGIMQLGPEVLDDCEIPDAFRLHRIAQVDCALRLMEQNHRNLQGPFETRFGHLPQDKREELYTLLLSQAYQIGVGRAIELLQDEVLGNAAEYFADNHAQFSARDILVGMIFHNLGRRDIGLRTLYYVTDVQLAQTALCRAPAMSADPWCN